MDSQKIYDECIKTVKGAARAFFVGFVIGSTFAHHGVYGLTRRRSFQAACTYGGIFSAFGAAKVGIVDLLEHKYGMERENGFLIIMAASACVVGYKGRNLAFTESLGKAMVFGSSFGFTSTLVPHIPSVAGDKTTVAGQKTTVAGQKSRAPNV